MMFFSVLGAILIVFGLYSVLWGKYKEYKEMEEENQMSDIPEPVKIGGATATIHDDIEMQKNCKPTLVN